MDKINNDAVAPEIRELSFDELEQIVGGTTWTYSTAPTVTLFKNPRTFGAVKVR